MSRPLRPLAPRAAASGAHVTLDAVAGTVASIPIPGSHEASTRPAGFQISFTDASDAAVRGRLGVAAANHSVPATIVDADDELGHVFPGDFCRYPIAEWATQLLVAGEANGLVFVAWLYEV